MTKPENGTISYLMVHQKNAFLVVTFSKSTWRSTSRKRGSFLARNARTTSQPHTTSPSARLFATCTSQRPFAMLPPTLDLDAEAAGPREPQSIRNKITRTIVVQNASARLFIYSAFWYQKMYSALHRTLLYIQSAVSLPGGTPRPSADVGSSCTVSGGVRFFMNCFDRLQTLQRWCL